MNPELPDDAFTFDVSGPSPEAVRLSLPEFAFIIGVVQVAAAGALLALRDAVGEALEAIVAHLG
jgi:hypothetical protein